MGPSLAPGQRLPRYLRSEVLRDYCSAGFLEITDSDWQAITSFALLAIPEERTIDGPPLAELPDAPAAPVLEAIVPVVVPADADEGGRLAHSLAKMVQELSPHGPRPGPIT